jgi:ABC-type antimicrobial peptide transport system permease subunit
VRTTNSDPQNLAAAIAREIHSLDKDLPVTEVSTFDQILSREASPKRFNTGLLSIFAALALLLAATGVYGVTSYTVAQRTREVGIRMALGAARGHVIWMVMREVLLLVTIGVAAGVIFSLMLTRVVQSQLFGLTPHDPFTLALATAALVFVACAAGYIPAWRASRLDPMAALRYE